MSLNKELLLKVADAIATEEVAKFDMEEWIYQRRGNANPCGTSACIAGHAVLMDRLARGQSYEQAAIGGRLENTSDRAALLLGLDQGEANELFLGGPYSLDQLTENRCRVVGALRWMAETGTINWRKAFMATGGDIPEIKYD